MTSTFDGDPAGRPDVASGLKNGEPVRSFDLTALGTGTGSIWSTVGDLVTWDRALAEGELLSDPSRQAMFAAHAPMTEDDGVIRAEGYGFGWVICTAAGRRVFCHPGDNAGFRSFNAWFPDEDVRLAVLTNEFATDVDLIVGDLIRKAF